MTKREFLDIVFVLAPNEANKIMDAFDEYVESAQLGTNLAEVGTGCSEFPNNSDTINRQAAIEAVQNRHMMLSKEKVLLINDLEKLPSAQPEIIRCTECKHYREYDSKYVENAVVVQCMADRYPISETIPDGWFCAGAERKDDE